MVLDDGRWKEKTCSRASRTEFSLRLKAVPRPWSWEVFEFIHLPDAVFGLGVSRDVEKCCLSFPLVVRRGDRSDSLMLDASKSKHLSFELVCHVEPGIEQSSTCRGLLITNEKKRITTTVLSCQSCALTHRIAQKPLNCLPDSKRSGSALLGLQNPSCGRVIDLHWQRRFRSRSATPRAGESGSHHSIANRYTLPLLVRTAIETTHQAACNSVPAKR